MREFLELEISLKVVALGGAAHLHASSFLIGQQPESGGPAPHTNLCDKDYWHWVVNARLCETEQPHRDCTASRKKSNKKN